MVGLLAMGAKPKFTMELDPRFYKYLQLTSIDYFNNKIEDQIYDKSAQVSETKINLDSVGKNVLNQKSHGEIENSIVDLSSQLLIANMSDDTTNESTSKKNTTEKNKEVTLVVPINEEKDKLDENKDKKVSLFKKTFETTGENIKDVILNSVVNKTMLADEDLSVIDEETQKQQEISERLKKRKTKDKKAKKVTIVE